MFARAPAEAAEDGEGSALPVCGGGGRFLGVAPVCWFCLCQAPVLAPSAICWAVYTFMPAACCLAEANACVVPRYLRAGQLAISLLMFSSRFPGLGWSLKNWGPPR